MKALVYFDEFKECKENKNKVTVDKKRLQEIFNEIYNAGYADGVNKKDSSLTWTMPKPTLNGNEITCNKPYATATALLNSKNT